MWARLVFDVTNDEASVGGAKGLILPAGSCAFLGRSRNVAAEPCLRESLEQAVFGFDDEVQSNTLDSHISRLRRKLTDANAQVEIHAIKGVGYLLKDPS